MNIAFYLPGNIPVFTFSLLLGTAAVVGLARLVNFDDSEIFIPGGVILLFFSLIGAKLGNWLAYPGSTFLESGLSWAGAFIGAGIGLSLVGLSGLVNARDLADRMVTAAAALMIAGWLGCWLDGCAYGPADAQWFAVPARDEWGNTTTRLPLQLIGALFAGATLLIVDIASTKIRIPGTGAALWLILTGAQLTWLQGLRADPTPLWLDIRTGVWSSWGLLAAGIFLYLYTTLVRKKSQDQSTEKST